MRRAFSAVNRRSSITIFFYILFALISYRLLDLHFISGRARAVKAEIKRSVEVPLYPKRGRILDRAGVELSVGLKRPSLFAIPHRVNPDERKKLATDLAKILDDDPRGIENRLSVDRQFSWIKRVLTDEQTLAVMNLNSEALSFQDEYQRFYPFGHELGQVLGFCNLDNKGIDGLEKVFEDRLKGTEGLRKTRVDAFRRQLAGLDEKIIRPLDGTELVLNIDHFIQHVTERELDKAFRKWKAVGAVAIVMNPKNGEILAISNRPAFDPNRYRENSDANVRRNRAVTDIYEPGSVFKAVTVAAAIEEGVVTMDDVIFCENGTWQYSRRRKINDVHPYGKLSVRDVLVKSSNIGTVKIAEKVGPETLYEYIRRFGFGQQTGIDLPGEVSGILRPLDQWSGYSMTSIPYGQEIAATAIQTLQAISVIANGGQKVQPWVVRELRDASGVVLEKKKQPEAVRVIQNETAKLLTEAMVGVVELGTGKMARIPGVKVAGKTGTTQKLDPKGGYSHSHHIASFAGFAPADDPVIAMIVLVDDPGPSYYGGTVAGPVFSTVVEEALLYLGVLSPPLAPLQIPASDVKVNQ